MIANIFHKNIHINKSLNISNTFFSYFNKRSVLQTKFKKKNDTSYNLPFKVSRTISGNLPVYPKIRRHGTIVTTIVRHIYGDIKVFKDHLRNICEAPVREHVGYIEVKGLHTLKIKQWLQHIGF
ncbi:putative mitochondrial large subunit ribosomal protein [Plasmodium gaboni]|uniref:Large ribosomal subunit protein mL49 n=1 Tax=Plasmodium gaboni TaxID=647221 RepID=A0A151LJG0_9APIC|nr:putative mitochondrial large subunit ribosomal protein [Plasmodium gaboni]XP_028539134.1 mitochondrial large subunit ribosomal protein, putative [Plasmodium sp. gorilla clade G2]SOV23513.1 mitochondrial large subunit ribosomal protein, putative [Plasmodium sp. DRC-Itaito]KYN99074.1 putative mitochondrial large subunit ribosomal protein [Plasmodium gaboni]SOV16053.1 mitochondrial large subunit ribosomal protein, putative [Plasmodium gaboni]SOV16092.1 mitochondrial large subunit ribosomal pro